MPNIFAIENAKELSKLIKSMLVEVRDLKEQIIELKKLQNITREELRNVGNLKPLRK